MDGLDVSKRKLDEEDLADLLHPCRTARVELGEARIDYEAAATMFDSNGVPFSSSSHDFHVDHVFRARKTEPKGEIEMVPQTEADARRKGLHIVEPEPLSPEELERNRLEDLANQVRASQGAARIGLHNHFVALKGRFLQDLGQKAEQDGDAWLLLPEVQAIECA